MEPDHVRLRRTRELLEHDAPSHTNRYADVDAFSSVEISNNVSLEAFKESFRIEVQSMSDDEVVFDIVGVDVPIVNALRRILLADVPTMAIDVVHIHQNTSVIPDEVLAHRIGLIPLNVDPVLFEPHPPGEKPQASSCVVFELTQKCDKARKKKGGAAESSAASAATTTRTVSEPVYSKALKFHALEGQEGMFKKDPAPVHDDILIAKLRPGEVIQLEGHAILGNGREHAKWSPVCTAFYRLHPDVIIKRRVVNEDAEEMVSKCPMNVFDIEDAADGFRELKAARPRQCTMCRECIREEKWRDFIQLARVKDHFIFSIESSGAVKATDLFRRAVKYLVQMASSLAANTKNLDT